MKLISDVMGFFGSIQRFAENVFYYAMVIFAAFLAVWVMFSFCDLFYDFLMRKEVFTRIAQVWFVCLGFGFICWLSKPEKTRD